MYLLMLPCLSQRLLVCVCVCIHIRSSTGGPAARRASQPSYTSDINIAMDQQHKRAQGLRRAPRRTFLVDSCGHSNCRCGDLAAVCRLSPFQNRRALSSISSTNLIAPRRSGCRKASKPESPSLPRKLIPVLLFCRRSVDNCCHQPCMMGHRQSTRGRPVFTSMPTRGSQQYRAQKAKRSCKTSFAESAVPLNQRPTEREAKTLAQKMEHMRCKEGMISEQCYPDRQGRVKLEVSRPKTAEPRG